jgi:homoserine O-acetyltransferase
VAISSDLLFTPEEVRAHVAHTPGAEYHEIDSLYGHDGFLLENEKLDQAIKSFYQSKSTCHAK